MASCPQGQQDLGRLRGQAPWAPREYKHHSLLVLPTKGSPNGYICKTHNTQQSAGQESRSSNLYHQTPGPGILFSPSVIPSILTSSSPKIQTLGLKSTHLLEEPLGVLGILSDSHLSPDPF